MDVIAPSHWACIDLVSDLHLQAGDPATWGAWQQYLRHTQADALFILGDLFEVWVGDDKLDDPAGFAAGCAAELRAAARRLPVYILHGNRDFLMGQRLMQSAGTTLLDDPCVLEFGGLRWMFSHGDAWCLEDRDYMQFRTLVRSPGWQQGFLAKPLGEREDIAREIRNQSDANKHADDAQYADVDHPAANTALQACQATHLVHGHTHRPACHHLGNGHQRWVLSDWDLSAAHPRAEILRLRRQAASISSPRITLERIPPAMA